MSKDDPRMHGHNTPGMVGEHAHERHEEPVRLNHPEPGEDQPGMREAGGQEETGNMREQQPSALGGHTATTTGTERGTDEAEG